ncbi:MAG TPA: glycoside hydrolase family 16 protein [Candidatus Limnocylindrales bacterium]|nr:glycoside hydrolase family 16 protein [Candidatus Limnocylindrales bacterium]
MGDSRAAAVLDRSGYELEVADEFDRPRLDDRLWFPHYLPQWSSRAASAARYAIRDGALHLQITADQEPWCPEFDGALRVSSLQTGLFAGPLGSPIGQHRFRPDLVVREEQPALRLYTPQYGLIEARARATDDPDAMVALWLIGYEDEPDRSAEICVFEIFGRDVGEAEVAVGMGVHPFGDPSLADDFSRIRLPIDARAFHVYSAEWTPGGVAFYVDGHLVRAVNQSPAYPMQVMLGIYELTDDLGRRATPGRYPKELVVDWFRAYRPASTHPSRGSGLGGGA